VISWRQVFSGARRTLRALAGGVAPRAFRRQLLGSAGAGGDLRRRTAWLPELAAVRPRLRSGPLFGGALAELTGGEPPAAEPAPPAVRRDAVPGGDAERREWSPRPRPAPLFRSRPRLSPERGGAPFPAACDALSRAPRHAAERDGLSPETAPPRALAAPLAFAARADRSLLERLSSPPRAISPVAANGGKNERTPRFRPFPAALPGRGAPPALAADTAAEAHWRREILHRAKPVRRDVRTAAPAFVSSKPARIEKTEESLEASSAPTAWQLPLDGERAPREVLDRLRSSGAFRPGAAASPAGRRGSPPWPPALPGRSRGGAPTERKIHDAGFEADETLASPAGRLASPRPLAGAPSPAGLGNDSGAARAPAADLAAETAPLLVSPPSLPPFLEVHAATEVVLRRPSTEGPTGPGIPPRVPVLLPEDDLADRIDRLLAEEARRHGIDV
jgi:hypothetical protein